MMERTSGLTRLEVIAGLVAGAALATVVMVKWHGQREEARVIRCRNNLNCLSKAMYTYLNEHGDNQWFPCPLGRGRTPGDYNGAEWQAILYWVGTRPDPNCYLCPSSGDSNDNGRDLGTAGVTARFGSQTVSYAAMHWRSVDPGGSAIRDDYPPNEIMASDDTEGTVNHGTGRHFGMGVLFFDSHVEWRTAAALDPSAAVGQKGGVLERLRN
jgi:hypothetical protein